MKLISNFLIALIVFAAFSVNARAQYKAAPFSVEASKLIEELRALKSSNPKIATAEFVKTANALLEKQGLNFVVAFDDATCRKIGEAVAGRKDKTAPLNLLTALKSPLGETANLLLPEVSFAPAECFACHVKLPILETTAKEFVTLVQGKNIKFFLPANFILNEAFLVDAKDLKTVRNSWKLPFRTTPLSISDEGNILYLGFPEPELSDLALMAFGREGVFQFTAKSEIDAGKTAAPLKEFPKDAANPHLAFIKFTSGDAIEVVKFSKSCGS